MKIINCNKPGRRQNRNRSYTEVCQRHILVFGQDCQDAISSLNIGVIATGGLGSLVLEQLMRLFPGKLTYIDNDQIEATNINRLVGASMQDSQQKLSKVDLITRNIQTFNPIQTINPINGDFLKLENQNKFRGCDFIIGTSDSNAVRIATNRLCLAHGIPYLDCGVGAVVKNGQLEAAGGQVIKILPDSGFCLHCSGLFHVEEAMKDFLDEREIAQQEQLGYIRGANIPAPQVYSLNMMIASWAVWLFARMVSGDKLNFDGIAIDAKDLITNSWQESTKPRNDCPTCGENGITFAGDDTDLLCKDSSDSNKPRLLNKPVFISKDIDVGEEISSGLHSHSYCNGKIGESEVCFPVILS